MQKKVIDFNQEIRGKKAYPDFQSGDVVRVHLKIKEGSKERIQVFEGLIIAIKGGQSSSKNITVRKVTHGVGVEMIVPIYSKNVEKIEIVKHAKVRRAKLYYVRDLTAKQGRMKYKEVAEFVAPEEKAAEAEPVEVAEAPEEKEANQEEVSEKKTADKKEA